MAVARSNSEAGASDMGLPQVPLVRQQSPRLVSSFQLADGQSWDSTFIINDDELENTEPSKRGYADWLLSSLGWFGWLRQDYSMSTVALFVITWLMDFYVVVTTIYGAHLGNSADDSFRQIHQMDSISRHSLVLACHFLMFWIGGCDLAAVLRGSDIALPRSHVVLLFLLMLVEYVLDFVLLVKRHEYTLDGFYMVGLRRVFIMLGRLPSAVSLMVMLSMPKRLCQDLVRVVYALESSDIPEAHRLYSVFWKRLRVARKWYNAVMTPHFLIAVCRLPICLFTLGQIIDSKKYEFDMVVVVAYTIVDIVQMLIWISPAIVIRMNHGVALSAAVEQAGQPTVTETTTKARELATMMASLHPLVGLKFLGFIVTWRLVLQVQTLTAILMSWLKSFDYGSSGASADMTNSTKLL